MKYGVRAIGLCWCLFGLIACGGTVKKSFTNPAYPLSKVSSIAILPFDGVGEAGAASDLLAMGLAVHGHSRNTMEAGFRNVSAMRCEKGSLAIPDEACWQLGGNPGGFYPICGDAVLATQTIGASDGHILDHQDFWKSATRFYPAETLSNWRKRKNMLYQPAKLSCAITSHDEPLSDTASACVTLWLVLSLAVRIRIV